MTTWTTRAICGHRQMVRHVARHVTPQRRRPCVRRAGATTAAAWGIRATLTRPVMIAHVTGHVVTLTTTRTRGVWGGSRSRDATSVRRGR